MNAEAKVSVVITTFNQSLLTLEAIESVRAQTYGNVETIVVDDGSTDDVHRCLSERFGNDIRYLYQDNRGPAAARNLGIRAATGEYVQFLDGDDLLLPEKLEAQVRALESRRGFQAVYCDYARFTGSSERYLTAGTHRDRYRSGNLWRSLIEGNLLLSHTPLVALEWVRRVAGFDEDRRLSGCEDYDLWLRLAHHGCCFYYLDEVLALYRRTKESASSDHDAQRRRTVRVLEKIPSYAPDLPAEEREALDRYLSRLNLFLAHSELKRLRLPGCLRHLSRAVRHDPGTVAFVCHHLFRPAGGGSRPVPVRETP